MVLPNGPRPTQGKPNAMHKNTRNKTSPMKSKQLLCTLLLSLAGLVQAQNTTYWVGNNDNSLTATGVAAQNFQNGGWKDLTTFENLPNTAFNGSPLGITGASLMGGDRNITYFGFNTISGFTAGQVISASIYGNINDATYLNQVSGSQITITTRGLALSQLNFSETTSSWNTLNDTHLTTNYGSFTVDPSIADGSWLSMDVTNALKDYLNGTIGGIAFEITRPGDSFTASDQTVQLMSQENTTASLRPGMMVNVAPVPEPSGALLGGLAGMIGLLRRRRPAPPAPQP